MVAIEQVSFSDPPWTKRAFTSLVGDPRVRFTVACGPEVLGYSVLWVVADEGELANLAVAPPLRRHGIGRRLLEQAVAEAMAQRVTTLYLEVRESNVAARKLYGGRGFAVVGRRPGYYLNPVEDALLLRLKLSAGASGSAVG